MTEFNETPDLSIDDTEGHRVAKDDADDTEGHRVAKDDADDTEGHRQI